MADYIMIDEPIDEFQPEWLDVKFEPKHLDIAQNREFSSDFLSKWRIWAKELLSIEPAGLYDLEKLADSSAVSVCTEVLGKWRRKYGRKATFGQLVEVFLKGDDVVLAEKVCKYLKAYESTPSLPHSQVSIDSEVVVSKPDIYHSSVLCVALSDNQKSHTRLHFLREMSISQSSSGKYLVAVSDRTTFIAFQSELDLREWTKKYDSFSEGIAQQSQEFPLSFILELLNKPTRVVLTGFLLGGLLACSITTQIWKCGVFSAQHLQERLSCITFSQPFINLPGLPELVKSHPEIVSTLHAIYKDGDAYPKMIKYLNLPIGHLIHPSSYNQHQIPPPFKDDFTSRLIHLTSATLNIQEVHSLWQDTVIKHLQPRYSQVQRGQFTHIVLTPGSINQSDADIIVACTKLNSHETPPGASECLVESMKQYAELVSEACAEMVPEVSQGVSISPAPFLEPLVKKVELCYFGSECVISVEGSNLHFCNKLSIKVHGDSCSLSGSALQINAHDKSGSLRQENENLVSVEMQSPFSTCSTSCIFTVQKFPMSMRQKQLSRLSPAKVIELSYLSALLEYQSHKSTQSSSKVDCIKQFLEEIVKVVPIESIVYAANSGNPFVARKCKEMITTSGFQSHLSMFSEQQSSESSSITCDQALTSLIASNTSFQSPIETLNRGREKLIGFSLPSVFTHTNSKILYTVNQIRENELALSISLIKSIMNIQLAGIPLSLPGSSPATGDGLHVNTFALAGLGLEEVHLMLVKSDKEQMLVHMKRSIERGKDETDQDEINYAEKLYFLLQCLSRNVVFSKKCEMYSLERQLVSVCQDMRITESISLSDLVSRWDWRFLSRILSIVAKPHRPLIARWLKWSLMVHNLREELAKYTAVGVVGLVNSGKSTLVELLFRIKTASGTTEEKRTTVPFIYNLEDKVDGLDVVDFPGVDDRDESISGLADLLLTLAQITIFVVDYRNSCTESSKKWLSRLREEKVPFLVCLTYADKLYAELMTREFGKIYHYQSLSSEQCKVLRDAIDEELQSIRDRLKLPEEQKIYFCSFSQDLHSVLNCDEDRLGMKDMGICTPLEVADWLVETFRKLGQDDMALRLEKFLQPPQEAFVSLVTNDSYALGAIVLGKSLRNTGTLRKLALLITPQVSMDMRHRLSRLWDELVLVEEVDSGDAEHLSLLARPELGVTFSKIHAWRLTQYTKCVFLDADTLVLQNVDELFSREELSAVPDIGWPDCFNSGVFVFEPSLETFSNLLDLARQKGSFDGGDQGLLNTYWSEWATKDIKYHLLFIYNVTPNITYGYAPAFQRFGQKIKIIHFIGPTKPWHHRYLSNLDSVMLYPGSYSSEHASQDFIRQWWQLYMQEEQLPEKEHSSLQAVYASTKSMEQVNFEEGNVEVSGQDSFENIQKHIANMLGDV